MDLSIHRKLQLEYEKKRNNAIYLAKAKKMDLFNANPTLFELDSKINSLGIALAKASLLNDESKKIFLLKEIEDLKIKKDEFLKSIDVSLDDFSPKFDCSFCDDTGVDKVTHKTCTCYKQRLVNLSYNLANMNLVDSQTFDSFDVLLYSDKIDKDKYGVPITPRENIKKIKQIALDFVSHFDYPDMKNLLFLGDTGLGKTFLSSAIAHSLLADGKTVIYQTAPRLLDTVMNYKMRFDRNSSFNESDYNDLFNVDLLIIDDLGTESINPSRLSEIFNIINTRMLSKASKGTKTLLSTNLSIEDFAKRYDDRAMSRILGDFRICVFFGDDIRLKK